MYTVEQIEIIANEIAAKHAFTYDSNQGTKDAFTFQVKVRRSAGDILLHADCNAQISQARAKAELLTVWNELKAAVVASGTPARVIKTRGYKEWRTGFWHMNRFDTCGFARGMRLTATTVVSEAAE